MFTIAEIYFVFLHLLTDGGEARFHDPLCWLPPLLVGLVVLVNME